MRSSTSRRRGSSLEIRASTMGFAALLALSGTANENPGFNLRYESPNGWKTTGSWYTVPGNDRWYTKTWTVSDDEFVGVWGFHFRLDSDSTEHSKYYIQKVTVRKVGSP